MYHLDDTIAAIASARGPAARGIVRASGQDVVAIFAEIFRPAKNTELTAVRRPARIEGGLALDGHASSLPGSLLLWPTRSYTGEPLVEWHTLSSSPLLEASLRTILRAGARLAEPGEFTLRAFLAGRLDLTQAEAVLGVIDAENSGELRRALDQLAGGLAHPMARVRQNLVELLIELEAGLDFVEEKIEFIEGAEVRHRLEAALAAVKEICRQLDCRGESADLRRAVLRGSPNAGKSSLFNALIGEPSAIVAAEAGTTRDYLEARLRCGTLHCRLVDTAGTAPPSTSEIESAAQSAAYQQARDADLELFCLDATRPPTEAERAALARSSAVPRLVVLTKNDTAQMTPQSIARGYAVAAAPIVTSSHTGEGLNELRRAIADALSSRSADGSVVTLTAIRSREALDRTTAALEGALLAANQRRGEELIAEEIRAALDGLGTVVGAVYTDELLDGIFSRFCIGK